MAVEYDGISGMLKYDFGNDNVYELEIQWTPGLIFTHISGSAWNGTDDNVQQWDWIELYGESASDLEPTAVPLDIKPGSCTNPLNVKSRGVLPVAILGTEDFDVNEIDIATIRLAGVAPIRSALEDIGAPPDDYNCEDLQPDGFDDLILKFKTQEIVQVLREVEDGDEFLFTLTGELADETEIEGEDVVLILKKGKK